MRTGESGLVLGFKMRTEELGLILGFKMRTGESGINFRILNEDWGFGD